MEAAKIDSAAPQSSAYPVAPKAPRVSRFSSTLLTKKLYYPQENLDIDYTMIFNGPYRSTIETETHTTLSLGGTAVGESGMHHPQTIVTSMDEPLYVMISASNKEDLEAAEAMVSAVFTKLDHARRLTEIGLICSESQGGGEGADSHDPGADGLPRGTHQENRGHLRSAHPRRNEEWL